jgi:hypothetical protein
MNQDNTPDMFPVPPFGNHPRKMARSTDPDTSQAAAEKVDSAKMERMVYEVICLYPNGCTLDEIHSHFPGRWPSSISPRLAPLMRKGFIYDTGERRPGASGRGQRVLKKTEDA